MTRLLSSVLVASVLAMGMPLAASARDYNDDHNGRNRRPHCHIVKKCYWKHGHKVCFKKRVCEVRHHD
jgi:Ni/Co efflux regulator RcnB